MPVRSQLARARSHVLSPPRLIARALLGLPRPIAAALAGRTPIQLDGLTLDPQVQLLVQLDARLGLPPLAGDGAASVEQARARMRRRAKLLVPRAPRHERRELQVEGGAGRLAARLYSPAGAGSARLPGLVFFHGGGWVVGDVETHDPVCAKLAVDAGLRVISVEYRLAPETRYPGPVEDAITAFRDVHRRAAELGLDPNRIGVGGDSAGGNLAAAACLCAREAGGPMPAAQVLIYPGLDTSRRSRSEELFGRGFLLTAEDIAWFKARYFTSLDRTHEWRASPLRASELGGLPRAVIATAGFDPIRDDGREYAARLSQAGVAVEELREDGLVHGYLHLAGAVQSAARAFDALSAATRRALA